MSQRDERDLFQNKKTGQDYSTEGGKVMRRKAAEVEWCAGSRTDKAEPGAAGELGVCLSACQPASKIFSHLFSGPTWWQCRGTIEAAAICLAQEGYILSVQKRQLVRSENLLTQSESRARSEHKTPSFLFLFYSLFAPVSHLFLWFLFFSLWPCLHLALWLPAASPSLQGKVQCRCWCLSIMKRQEEKEGRARRFISYSEMNYSPSGVQYLCTMCAFLWLPVLMWFLLYQHVACVEMYFVSPWPHASFWLHCKSL